MPIKLIGKSVLGDLGLCLSPSKMGVLFRPQLERIQNEIPEDMRLAITSITGIREKEETNSKYLPKIREYDSRLHDIFDPKIVYRYVQKGLDSLRPGSDFVLWDSKFYKLCCLTFSREAPILAFESSFGQKALGVILRPSLMKHGDYLFETMQYAMNGNITVTLVTCNHYEYPEGTIPDLVRNLAQKYNMSCVVCYDSQKEAECYHRDETGNHVVAMW